MKRHIHILGVLLPVILTAMSCDDGKEKPRLRTKIEYSSLTPETEYQELFVDAQGISTVDAVDGTDRLRMFYALDFHSNLSIASGEPIDETVLKDMFENNNDPFYDISTTGTDISGQALNNSHVELRNVVASSLQEADAEVVRKKIESYFTAIDVASASAGMTAAPGKAGMLGDYLVDSRGLETAQIIQKSLTGALQLDYISNVLLDEGLDADNSRLADGRHYTELEHNWDVAYGLLTLNPIYLDGATNQDPGTTEFGLGAAIWEHNGLVSEDIYPAFLQGRAAIVNNDRDQYMALATFIRREFELSLASAAVANLVKWKTSTDDAAKAHAIGQAIGFIYSTRFATLHEANATFSDTILENLVGSGNGFWDLNDSKVDAAIASIEAKFER